MDQLKKAFQYVDDHFNEMIDDVKELCRYRSVAGDEKGLNDTRTTICRRMERAGISPEYQEVSDGNAMITATVNGQSPEQILFYNHYDVVEEGNRDLWENDPFNPRVRDGKIYARGVSDNKGALLSRIHAVEAILKTNDDKLPVNVKFLLEGDEESSSPSMTRFAKEKSEKFYELVNADLCLWENGRRDESGHPWARFGVRGNCTFDLSVSTANADVHSRMGAIIPSASWRLVWALASLKSADEKVLIPGFYDDILQMTERDKQVLYDFPYEEEGQLNALGLNAYLCNAGGDELKRRCYYEPSFSICGIESGEMYNGVRGIVPHTAHARIAFYLVADQDPNKIYEQLRAYLDKQGFSDVKITPNGTMHKAVRTSADNPAREHLEWAAAQVYEERLLIEPTQVGAGPAEVLRWVCPELPIIGIGPANTNPNHHAPNENMSIEDYRKAIKFVIALLYSYE